MVERPPAGAWDYLVWRWRDWFGGAPWWLLLVFALTIVLFVVEKAHGRLGLKGTLGVLAVLAVWSFYRPGVQALGKHVLTRVKGRFRRP